MTGKKKAKGQKEAANLPFDEAALSKLTARIDTELSKPKPKPKPKTQKQKDERPGKRKRNDDDHKDATPKKRQAQEVKQRLEKPKKTTAHGSGKPKKSSKDKTAEMLEEIKLLGGDEADLDLVAGVDSDAEEGLEANTTKAAPADVDNAFKNALAKFAAGLGFDKVRDEDAATDDEVEEQGQQNGKGGEEGWEDEPEDEGEEDAKEKEEAPPAEKSQSRFAAGKLVSPRRRNF